MNLHDYYRMSSESERLGEAYNKTMYNHMFDSKDIFVLIRGHRYRPTRITKGLLNRNDLPCISIDVDLNNQNPMQNALLGIKKVVFNPPATIVYWDDNTRTVVKTQLGEDFDPEKGLAMAITKKALGNTGAYFNEINKWVVPYITDNLVGSDA